MPASPPASSHARGKLTRRGKLVATGATLAVVAGGAFGYFALFPQQAPAFVRQAMATVGLGDRLPGDEAAPPAPRCPLKGTEAPDGQIPQRPALAVKVENLPDARPQAGLQSADIVYEEPVEGGITRFIVIYQCGEDDRVGPVRSARNVDPDVLSQFGVPVLAYSGGAPGVVRAIESADLVPLDETDGGAAYVRDPGRVAPHNLYADTSALLEAAAEGAEAPAPIFSYSTELAGKSRRANTIHLPFSPTYSDVYWSWDARTSTWVRAHGDDPHLDEAGARISAVNVVVQIVDAMVPVGSDTPEVELVGRGKAYVFRDGRMIVGRWERASLGDVTRFVTRDGTVIPLRPGRTWVELLPSSAEFDATR